ncbi:MAG: hypothetical protein HY901_18295 [Deltaproteobacteria bacterium]|nr:hypothetical protein [Deltaproteobacteria bacterium]
MGSSRRPSTISEGERAARPSPGLPSVLIGAVEIVAARIQANAVPDLPVERSGMHDAAVPLPGGVRGAPIPSLVPDQPGLDEVIALLARGLARALEQARQPCPPAEGKSPRLQ